MSWQFGCSPSIILNWLKFAQEKHENFYWFLTNMNANITLKVSFSQWIYLLTHSFSIPLKNTIVYALSPESVVMLIYNKDDKLAYFYRDEWVR